MNRRTLIVTIAVLLIVLVAIIGWIMFAPKGTTGNAGSSKLATATNPALDIRFSYDPLVFTAAPYDERAEYPMQLDAAGWSLHGKRIAGLGAMLEGAPAPMLYDFVASQHAEIYEDWYKLERVMEEYEDATIQNRLAVHCMWRYKRTAETPALPYYLPEAARTSGNIEAECWALYTEKDLFFFYTFSAEPLTDANRSDALNVLDSIQFNALGLETGSASRGDKRQDNPEAEVSDPPVSD